jgi:hypothetical protein
MRFFDALKSIGSIITKPIELLTDWGREPLKGREHSRNMERETNSIYVNAQIEKERLALEAKLKRQEQELQNNFNINLEQEKNKTLKLLSELKIKEQESETNLAIKKQTEVHKIISEIDELQKDKDFQRMKLVSESIMKYQEELTKLNVNAINAIGHMQLELREKAQDLVYNKTVKYKELQDKAIKEAGEDLEKILLKFPDNERVQDIMIKAVDKRLSNIIDTAQNFLLELNEDIKLLNKSINSLAEGGQKFIEKHLDNFHQIPNNSNYKMIENKDNIIDV